MFLLEDKQNVVGLVCEGFDNDAVSEYNNWGGIVFEKYAPYVRTQEHTSVFYNLSRSVLEYVDVQYAGLSRNKNRFRPQYDYMPGSAITVFQYAPRFDNILVEYSIGNGLNYSNIEAPAFISNSVFRHNRGTLTIIFMLKVIKSKIMNLTRTWNIGQDSLRQREHSQHRVAGQ